MVQLFSISSQISVQEFRLPASVVLPPDEASGAPPSLQYLSRSFVYIDR